jgi:hypothetical protein
LTKNKSEKEKKMKRGKKVKMMVAGIILAVSGLVAGCGVDVDVDENVAHHCGDGYRYCAYSDSCCPHDGCCGSECNKSDVSVDVDGPGVNVDVNVK